MNDIEKRQQEARIYQARMMEKFKISQEYLLIMNLLLQMRENYANDRKKSMRISLARDTVLYYTGKEDAVMEFRDEIDKIIEDGLDVLDKQKQLQEQLKED